MRECPKLLTEKGKLIRWGAINGKSARKCTGVVCEDAAVLFTLQRVGRGERNLLPDQVTFQHAATRCPNPEHRCRKPSLFLSLHREQQLEDLTPDSP